MQTQQKEKIAQATTVEELNEVAQAIMKHMRQELEAIDDEDCEDDDVADSLRPVMKELEPIEQDLVNKFNSLSDENRELHLTSQIYELEEFESCLDDFELTWKS